MGRAPLLLAVLTALLAAAPAAAQPTITASRSSLSFGNQALGTIGPASEPVVFSASGEPPAHVRAVVYGDADFIIVEDFCTNTNLAGDYGAMCSVRVRFAPGALGARTASLRLDFDNGHSESVTLSGTGVAAPAPQKGDPGPAGAPGSTGPQGPPGATDETRIGLRGPAGNPGRIICLVKRRTPLARRIRIVCTVKFEFVGANPTRAAIALRRGGRTVARGSARLRGRRARFVLRVPRTGSYRARLTVGSLSVTQRVRIRRAG